MPRLLLFFPAAAATRRPVVAWIFTVKQQCLHVRAARYKLFKVSGGRPFFAEVSVEATEAAGGPEVCTAPNAIAYGYDDWKSVAEEGVWYALRHADPQPKLDEVRVMVTRISGIDADTEESAVAAAACDATWEALNVFGTYPPRFEGRKIIFGP